MKAATPGLEIFINQVAGFYAILAVVNWRLLAWLINLEPFGKVNRKLTTQIKFSLNLCNFVHY
jgi:hypothetical protein